MIVKDYLHFEFLLLVQARLIVQSAAHRLGWQCPAAAIRGVLRIAPIFLLLLLLIVIIGVMGRQVDLILLPLVLEHAATRRIDHLFLILHLLQLLLMTLGVGRWGLILVGGRIGRFLLSIVVVVLRRHLSFI